MDRERAHPRHRRGLARAAVVGAMALLMAAPVLAAVEPGLYFDTSDASPGQRVLLFSAADYIVCWVTGAEEQAMEDRAVYLAPADARVSGQGDRDLTRVGGTWSERDGALFFSFVVPRLAAGSYLGYVACDDGTLDVSARSLRITATPSTDATAPAATSRGAVPGAILAVAGLLACLAGARRFGRVARRR
jgi:hypothetical protein